MTLKEKIGRCLEEAIGHQEAAGIGVLVRQDGEDLCCVLAGMADRAAGKPVARDSIFRLYSQTKPITAAAAMILVERGILDLQAGVDQYLPGFRNPRVITPDGTTEKTLRAPWIIELLGMTAGLCYPDVDAAGQGAGFRGERRGDPEGRRNGYGHLLQPSRGTAAGLCTGNGMALQHVRGCARRGHRDGIRETVRAIPSGGNL